MTATREPTTRVTAFFEELPRQPIQPLLEQAIGSIRFDLSRPGGGEHWLARVDRGRVEAERAQPDAAADAVVSGPGEILDRIVAGEANPTAALLRGEVAIDGDVNLMLLFQRLFPLPPSVEPPVPVSGKEEP